MPRPFSVALPPWLTHALRAQRGPVPWNAVVRGALAAGPLLLAAVLAGRESVGVMAALGAMLAGINDRPGSRRTAVHRIGVPGLAGAVGLVVGTYAGEGLGAVPLTLILTALGLLAGAVSAVGPVVLRGRYAVARRRGHRGRDAAARDRMAAGAVLPRRRRLADRAAARAAHARCPRP